MALALDEKLVEKIVGEVMHCLRPTSQPVRSEPARHQPSILNPQLSTLTVTDRVVTGELLAERLIGKSCSRLAICPKAVITPSAFDYLRTHKIVWHRNMAEAAPNPNKPITRWKAFVLQATQSVLQAVEHTENHSFGKQ